MCVNFLSKIELERFSQGVTTVSDMEDLQDIVTSNTCMLHLCFFYLRLFLFLWYRY